MPNMKSGRRAAVERIRSTDQPVGAGMQVPCVYCREPIAASAFTFWSSSRRLLSATCPTCRRRVTLTAATWRHWCTRAPAVVGATAAGVVPVER